MLESPALRIDGEVLDEHFGKEAPALLRSGFLVRDGDTRVIPNQDDQEDEPTSLSWSRDGSGYGYFSGISGWVSVPDQRLVRYRIDVSGMITSLISGISDGSAQAPVKLIDDILWDLGEVRLSGRTRRVPIWFARRLQHGASWRDVVEKMGTRPAADIRILLTSSPAGCLPARFLERHAIISVADVLAHQRGLVIDPEILAACLDNPRRASDEIVTHSADFGIVTIRGKNHRFTGSKQRELMRQLVEAYLGGSPQLLTSKALVEAGYADSVNTLGKAFSGRPDRRQFAAEKKGMCWLVV